MSVTRAGTRSPAQLEASRRNGRLSAGPVTTAGKIRVSGNGVAHGLRSERIVLAHEDPALYLEHVQDWVDSLRPGDEAELEVVASIADLRWRLQRLDQVELNRTRAEVYAQLEGTAEQRFLTMVEGAAQATNTMAEVLARPRVRDDEDLKALLHMVGSVIDMVRAVEAEQPRLHLGADQLAQAVGFAAVLSATEIDYEEFAALAVCARSTADAVAAQHPVARAAVERVKDAIAATVPLPDGKELALITRYRRDTERRLQAEMTFLNMVRDRKTKVAGTSGLLGQPIPIRLVGGAR